MDEHQRHLCDYIRKLALRACGSASCAPTKPWMSESTWCIVKWIAPLRRAGYAAARTVAASRLRVLLLAWAATLHAVFEPGVDCVVRIAGWRAAAACNEVRDGWSRLMLIRGLLFQAASKLHVLVRPLVKIDKLT